MARIKKSSIIIPKELSKGEEAFLLHCKSYGLEPLREYKFALPRQWRFDFLFAPSLAVEVEGGTRMLGRHSRHAGFTKDCEKYNAAALMGFTVLRYTTDMVIAGDAIRDVLKWYGK